MIPVVPQPEPQHFDIQVRQKGHQWLNTNGWALNAPPPFPKQLPPYWRATQRDLWNAYSGICAYLCIYFEWSLGASSTDHFVCKSAAAGQAYEWSNFRLSCLGANRRKGVSANVIDPFQITPGTFCLDLTSGEILPAQHLNGPALAQAHLTIRQLVLNSPDIKSMRAKHCTDCLAKAVSASYLQRHSPFVHHEMVRQGLLP